MRNEKTTAAAIAAVQKNIGCQTALVTQLDELSDSLVKPEGTVEISKNGTYDVKNAESVNVGVMVYADYLAAHGTSSLQLPKVVLDKSFILYADEDNHCTEPYKQALVLQRWSTNQTKYLLVMCLNTDTGMYTRQFATLSDDGLLTMNDSDYVFGSSASEYGTDYVLLAYDRSLREWLPDDEEDAAL